MRGFVLAVVLGALLVAGVFSFRPGGLRVQLRLMKRRFRVAFILVGIFLVLSFVVRIAAPTTLISDVGMVILGLVTAVTFLIWAQDPPLDSLEPPVRARR